MDLNQAEKLSGVRKQFIEETDKLISEATLASGVDVRQEDIERRFQEIGNRAVKLTVTNAIQGRRIPIDRRSNEYYVTTSNNEIDTIEINLHRISPDSAQSPGQIKMIEINWLSQDGYEDDIQLAKEKLTDSEIKEDPVRSLGILNLIETSLDTVEENYFFHPIEVIDVDLARV